MKTIDNINIHIPAITAVRVDKLLTVNCLKILKFEEGLSRFVGAVYLVIGSCFIFCIQVLVLLPSLKI